MSKIKHPRDSRTQLTEMVMPGELNPLGNLMGGNLMRWMDIAAGICASKHCETHVVTASVDHVSFSKPVSTGDIITIEASITRAFNTSVEVFLEVYVLDVKGNPPVKSNHAYFTMVALDVATHRPLKVPQIVPETEQEKALFDGAERRREVRLVLGGKMKAQDASALRNYFLGFEHSNG